MMSFRVPFHHCCHRTAENGPNFMSFCRRSQRNLARCLQDLLDNTDLGDPTISLVDAAQMSAACFPLSGFSLTRPVFSKFSEFRMICARCQTPLPSIGVSISWPTGACAKQRPPAKPLSHKSTLGAEPLQPVRDLKGFHLRPK